MPRVTYFREITLEDVPEGQTLLDLSIRHRIPHLHQCGGYGRCTTCRVQILDGVSNLSPLGEVEQKVASRRGWDEFTRLACQTRVEGDVVIRRLLNNAQDIIVLDLDETEGGTAGEGKEIDLAVLSSDIRDFTTLSEQSVPHDVVHMLNRYFTAAAEPVLNNNGFIDKYIGDGILVVFGTRGRHAGTPCALRSECWERYDGAAQRSSASSTCPCASASEFTSARWSSAASAIRESARSR